MGGTKECVSEGFSLGGGQGIWEDYGFGLGIMGLADF